MRATKLVFDVLLFSTVILSTKVTDMTAANTMPLIAISYKRRDRATLLFIAESRRFEFFRVILLMAFCSWEFLTQIERFFMCFDDLLERRFMTLANIKYVN